MDRPSICRRLNKIWKILFSLTFFLTTHYIAIGRITQFLEDIKYLIVYSRGNIHALYLKHFIVFIILDKWLLSILVHERKILEYDILSFFSDIV